MFNPANVDGTIPTIAEIECMVKDTECENLKCKSGKGETL